MNGWMNGVSRCRSVRAIDPRNRACDLGARLQPPWPSSVITLVGLEQRLDAANARIGG